MWWAPCPPMLLLLQRFQGAQFYSQLRTAIGMLFPFLKMYRIVTSSWLGGQPCPGGLRLSAWVHGGGGRPALPCRGNRRTALPSLRQSVSTSIIQRLWTQFCLSQKHFSLPHVGKMSEARAFEGALGSTGGSRAWARGGSRLGWGRLSGGSWSDGGPTPALVSCPTAGGHLARFAVLVNFQPARAGASSREGPCGVQQGGAVRSAGLPALWRVLPSLRFQPPSPVPLEPAESALGLWEGGAAATPEPGVEAGAFSGWHPALPLPSGRGQDCLWGAWEDGP